MELFAREAPSVNVATRLKELRVARNISMRTLATKSGLSANALSMIERGKTSPSVSTLYKLADALGISITAFFGTETDKQQVVFLKSDQRTRISFTRGVFEGLGGGTIRRTRGTVYAYVGIGREQRIALHGAYGP